MERLDQLEQIVAGLVKVAQSHNEQIERILIAQDQFRAAQATTDVQIRSMIEAQRQIDMKLSETTDKLNALINIVDRMQRPPQS